MAKKSGTNANDQLIGGTAVDQLYGKDGDDLLSGDDGDDFLSGGKGADRLIGGAGDDRLDAGSGDDVLEGGDGDDELLGRAGDDRLEGGDGDDELYGGDGDDHLIGGAGNDRFWGNQGDDVIEGGDGADRLDGQEGHDQLFGGAGNDELYGKDGDDLLSGDDGDDFLSGGKGADRLIGGAGHDRLDAGCGDDVLEGGAGNDELLGRAGDDRLDGGDGNDELYGGDGDDYLIGGAGNDRFWGNQGDDAIEGGDGADRLDGQEGHDQLFGGAGDDQLYGKDGDDLLSGDDGDDFLSSGDGADRLIGGAGDDRLDANSGGDVLEGGAGNDELLGRDGNDRLEGGTGNDWLHGGAGDDLFAYRTGDGSDEVIGDKGSDTIRLEVADGWALNLTRGKIVSDDGDQLQLSGGARGTITLADGSTIRFRDVERIETVAGPADDQPAPELTLIAEPVAENAPDGSVVGTAVAVGPERATLAAADGAGHELSYSLTDDAGGRFAIDSDTGVITVADGALLDHESAPQHAITVMVTDAAGLSASQTFTIAVADVNEAPGSLALGAGEIAENASAGAVVGTASAADPDAGETLTYSLTDDAGGRFAIDSQTGVITVADGALLDHESAPQHSIAVTVTDAGGLSANQTFTIAVADIDEAPRGLTLSAGGIAENAPAGAVVGTVSAADPDAGETLTYSLTDDAGGRFAIDPDTGVITVAAGAPLDHENAPQHAIAVTVTDAAGLSASQTFTIEVVDANEAPGNLTLSAGEVAESAPAGAVVGTVSAADPDAGETFTYSLTDDAGGRFAIDPDTGVVTVADGALLDHESAPQHAITVMVTDAGGLSASQTFTIEVGEANHAPHSLDLAGGAVAEGALGGTVVGTVSALDANADVLTYSLTDDADGRFAIDSQTGVITVVDGSLLDHETATQHAIEVTVTDAEGLSASASFMIAVADANEAPGGLALSGGEVAENAPAGMVVGTVSAADPDAGEALSYSLADDAGGRFAIDPESGVVTVADGTALDYEAGPQHEITVEVTDAGGLSATRTFTIAVAAVNEAPGDLALSASEIAEGAMPGTVVGTVSAADPDAGETFTYSLTDNAGGRFAIDPATGVVSVADGAALDYEAAPQHEITVEVTDAGGLSAARTFTIAVADVNEAPGALALSGGDVTENAMAGTVVGTASASDPDAGDALTYGLTDDAGGRFAIDPSTGVITVADGAALDHEGSPQHDVTVEVTDAGGLSATQTFTIAIADLNETPSIVGLDASEVAENAAAGTVVGTASATDPDAGDALTYSLTDDAGGRFAIDPATGVVTVAAGAAFDHADAAQHSIEITVTDAGGLSEAQTFVIDVIDVNEAPAIAGLSASEVPEDAQNGAVVGTVSASDPDPDDSLSYALSDDAGGRFAIDPSTGEITVADGSLLDHETASQHDIEVEVTDVEGLTATRTFTIAVADVNEAPGIVGPGSGAIHENTTTGGVVGTVAASDPDAGDTLIYSLTDDAEGRFAIDPSTGAIRVADGSRLDYESATQHAVEVAVTDAGGLSASQTFLIDVGDVNERPVIGALSSNQVIEGAPDDTVIGTVSALDPDMDDQLTFALTDDAGGRFAIDPDTGVVTVADGTLLDHDAADQHGIAVTVTDANGLSDSATYFIELQGDNSGNDTLVGGAGDDLLDGGPGDDSLDGGDGNDQLFGGGGTDSLVGGMGNDWLDGGDGDDFLFGNNGDDQLFGGDGNDQLRSSNGDDVLDGGAGDDQLFGNAGNDQIEGGDGNDGLFGSWTTMS